MIIVGKSSLFQWNVSGNARVDGDNTVIFLSWVSFKIAGMFRINKVWSSFVLHSLYSLDLSLQYQSIIFYYPIFQSCKSLFRLSLCVSVSFIQSIHPPPLSLSLSLSLSHTHTSCYAPHSTLSGLTSVGAVLTVCLSVSLSLTHTHTQSLLCSTLHIE